MNEIREHLLSTSCLFTVLPDAVKGTRQYPGLCAQVPVARLLLSGTAPPVPPAGGRAFSFSVCILLFARGLSHVVPPVRPPLWSLVVFFLPRVRLALVFDVLLRRWWLGIWTGLVMVGVCGEQVAVGLLELPPQARLPEGGPVACVLLWGPP